MSWLRVAISKVAAQSGACRWRTAAAGGLVLCFGAASQGQVQETEFTPSPTVLLSDSEMVVPTVNVSSMKIDLGDGYSVKPLYEVQGHQPRVVGLFVFAQAGTTAGDNLTAVWYQRPATECDDWAATTWDGATVGKAIYSLKSTFGIPAAQDVFWEASLDGGDGDTAAYSRGFVADDPMAPTANSLPAQQRTAFVGLLKLAGYRVSALNFEQGSQGEANAWLEATAKYFDAMIGRNLTGDDFQLAATQNLIAYGPPIHGPELCVDILIPICNWLFCPNTCTPQTLYGEWQPNGEVCNCTTTGPWAATCGTFTADAHGKIEIRIPFPPPLGSTVEMTVGVGATINACVCVWQRRCVGQAKRSVKHISADCSQSTSWEYRDDYVFTAYGWQIASSEAQCALSALPTKIPPNGQPCGLTNNQ